MKRRTLKHKTIRIFGDGGHSWAKVSRHELISLNIIHLISSYSYERNGYVYLEEDCDLGTYIRSLKGDNPNITIDFNTSYSNRSSKIRRYARFLATGEEKKDQYIENTYFNKGQKND